MELVWRAPDVQQMRLRPRRNLSPSEFSGVLQCKFKNAARQPGCPGLDRRSHTVERAHMKKPLWRGASRLIRFGAFLLLLAPTMREAQESEESIRRRSIMDESRGPTEIRGCTYSPRPHEKVFRP